MVKKDKVGRGRGRPRGTARGRGVGGGVISCGLAPGPNYSARKARPITSQNYQDVVDYLATQNTSSSAATTTTSTTSAAFDTSQELFGGTGDISDSQSLMLHEQDEGAEVTTTPHRSELGGHIMDVTSEEGDDDEVHVVGAVVEVSAESEDGQEEDVDNDTDASYLPNTGDAEEESSEGETESRRRRRRLHETSRGRSSSETAGGSVWRHVSPAMSSQPTCPATSAAEATIVPSPQGCSAVWKFFSMCASDRSKAICTLCLQKLSRGKPNTNVGTSALRRHLLTRHKKQWEEHLSKRSTQKESHPSSSPLPPSGASSSSAFSCAPPSQPPSSTPPLPLSGSCSSTLSNSQVSVKEIFERKKPISASHPLARRLAAGVAELLARQLLPYKLVESEAFRKFVAIGTPQWKIPGRNYFSSKVMPKLYREVERQVVLSLANSVGSRVHLTTDAWSAKHGQGRYITYTAHWVNLLDAGKQGVRGCVADRVVTPPRLAGRPLSTSSHSPPTPPATSSSLSSSSSSSSSAEWQLKSTGAAISSPVTQHRLPRAYAACQVQRCHAILNMACLKSESHTGAALLAALNKEVEQWLTPHQLEIGNVVCDNGSNLLRALNLGNLTHVPCMAHVLNLVVQRFVAKYPGLEGVLKQARKLCGHFRRSYTAMARFADIQRRNNMPVRRLICDSPTRWNSTLLMFSRLLEQEKAVTQYLYNYSRTTQSGEMGMLWPKHWTLMRNACRVLRPFEEVTNLVSRSQGTISDLIPYAYFLERAVRKVADEAVEERDKEDQLRQQEQSWDQFSSDPDVSSTPAAAAAQRGEEAEEEGLCGEEEEESDSYEEGVSVEEEEEAAADQQPQQASQGARAAPRCRGIVRGWGEEEDLPDVTPAEQAEMEAAPQSDFVQMASFMLSSLLGDPRIKKLKKNELYWVATLLDPRYRHKLADLFPTQHRAERMEHLQHKLGTMLYNAFKGDATAAQRNKGTTTVSNPPPTMSTQARTGGSGDLMSDMRTFFSPTPRRGPSGSTLHQRLDQQVAEYLALSVDVDIVFGNDDEPLEYWVRRLDVWPELSQFAMQVLSCPAASVLSERTFSAAGGIVTEKRSRLSHKSVQYLTFIKMNEAWIPESYSLPE